MKSTTCDSASALLVGQNKGRHAATALANEISEPVPNPGACSEDTHQAVVELLNERRPENEKRWEPHVPYVRPVSVCFKRWRWATQRELSELEFQESTFQEFQTEIAAISTDISLSGIGIVSMYDALPSRVTLEVDGTVFACEVCWSERIGAIHYRYGLHFQTHWTNPT